MNVADDDNQPEIKIFYCPFNAYHKLYDNRKLQFHIARCKDKRGKSLYHCKYFHPHIFTELPALYEHERTCERKTVKDEEDFEMVQQERNPSKTFCKYNYEHEFLSLADRETHEAVCPNKHEFERKFSQSQQVY